jgi:hypothetical protein
MRSSTTGGGSTGRRSADAIFDESCQLHGTSARRWKKGRTLCTGTTRTSAFGLLDHSQPVCDFLALTSNPTDGPLRLVGGRLERRSRPRCRRRCRHLDGVGRVCIQRGGALAGRMLAIGREADAPSPAGDQRTADRWSSRRESRWSFSWFLVNRVSAPSLFFWSLSSLSLSLSLSLDPVGSPASSWIPICPTPTSTSTSTFFRLGTMGVVEGATAHQGGWEQRAAQHTPGGLVGIQMDSRQEERCSRRGASYHKGTDCRGRRRPASSPRWT